MILVYTHRITSRVNFVFRHIFNNILQTEVKFTTKIEEFIAFNGAKFSYAPQALGKEFYIKSHPILYQQGIKPNEIEFGIWQNEPIFFQIYDASIPFDIFAASFYLLARYEEYLPHKLDEHERYHYKDSLQIQRSLLNKPIVEIWADLFKNALTERFPDLVFPERKFHFEPLINVSMATLYKHKAFLRFVGGGLNDLVHFRLKKLWLRHQVYFTKKKDPYDTFDEILRIKNKYKHNLSFFHLLTTYSVFDHNISKNKSVYQKEIKFLADYANTGLLTSYYTIDDEEMIEKEIKSLEDIIHKQVTSTKAHFNRIKLPQTYQHFNNSEIKDDYSMGYNHKIGFRAGTSIPFNFYDIENETETSLKLHPVTISDSMLKFQYRLSPEKALQIMINQGKMIQQYGGHFYPSFHNFILSNTDDWKTWNKLYTQTIKEFANAK